MGAHTSSGAAAAARPSPRHEEGNKRVVRHGRASTTTSIAHALVIKHDQLFFLCNPDGDVPLDESHGLGLYFHDTRYLDGYQLRLGGTRADRLASDAGAGFWATIELANPAITGTDGKLLEKERVGIKWERTLDCGANTLGDTIALSNFGVEEVHLPVEIALRSRFESLFEVRGAQPKARGKLHRPSWDGARLRFAYDGADDVRRELDVRFDPAPAGTDGTSAKFDLTIAPQQTVTLSVLLQVVETPAGRNRSAQPAAALDETRRSVRQSSNAWVAEATQVSCDSDLLGRVLNRSLRDLHLLRTSLEGRQYFAAGVPWYVTLFGRDSIISAIEALAFRPDRAEDTARLLASFQGTRHDDWRDEAPGKIMHELRFGEMAHLDEIPQTPYYGSVDATPLFLVLLARHAAWTGRLDLFKALEPHVEAALGWIDDSMAQQHGYLAYATASSNGLSNQGWKDSGDSIVNADGSLATPPIALVEVQGYVYMAKRGIADLYRHAGSAADADRLVREAEELRQRFERDFWVDDLGTYALALQKDLRPAAVVSSNPGQALWTGIVGADRAKKTVDRLMQDDMFSGWGIRTLSTREKRYNPIGYHDGTVWPHDNAIAVAGFRRGGCLDAIVRVCSGMIDAAGGFERDRLPEVFAGFGRREYGIPVHYPVACHPQAWAAGAVPFMLESALGLAPDAFSRRLSIAQPVLPRGVNRLTIERLRVGDATVKMTFVRTGEHEARVDDVKVDGRLDVGQV